VTELKRTQSALQQSEALVREERDRAQGYLDIAATMIIVLAADGSISLVNRRACEVLGRAEGELLGQDWFAVAVREEERESARSGFGRVIRGELEGISEFESVVLAASGEERLVRWHNTVLRGDDGLVTGCLGSGEDITDRRLAEQRVAFLAYHDPLTGLPNRAQLSESVYAAIESARRSNRSVGLLCLDLDDFKLVNDSLGHPVGDELLVSIARRLEQLKRHGDLLARTGGDEFFMLLQDLPADGLDDVVSAAKRVAAALAEPVEVEGAEFHVSASLGVSIFPRLAGGGEELLRQADTAMYQVKRAGRGGHMVYTPEKQHPLDRLSLTARLRRSVERNELELHYQPIYWLETGEPAGVEALLRWNDPSRGLVPPAAFIPAAEHSGLIEPIGEWVIDQSCRQAAEWQALGLTPRLNVNAAPRELRRPEYVDSLGAALERHGIEPSRVMVEVTESAAMDEAAARGPLERLHALGVGVAIDDFGEGFSSLSRLRGMPVEQIKIDRSFMRDVPRSASASAVVTAIIRLAQALGREVVAEGVETEEQRVFLAALGCPMAQGYHMARPLPAAEATALLLRA
jgi:diguanylate cyclase (GGDEF)-like protein/PAS domain S-box-containing protein